MLTVGASRMSAPLVPGLLAEQVAELLDQIGVPHGRQRGATRQAGRGGADEVRATGAVGPVAHLEPPEPEPIRRRCRATCRCRRSARPSRRASARRQHLLDALARSIGLAPRSEGGRSYPVEAADAGGRCAG